MGARDAERVEDGDRVGDQVAVGVAGLARRVERRPPGVAVVEPDDVAATRREPLAQLLLPPQHRGGGPVDQQDGRIAGSPKVCAHSSTPVVALNGDQIRGS